MRQTLERKVDLPVHRSRLTGLGRYCNPETWNIAWSCFGLRLGMARPIRLLWSRCLRTYPPEWEARWRELNRLPSDMRAGTIDRVSMGQKRPVQIVNFVAKGTIEEGMLSVLAFKRSLSAGILDGGSGEISLGGSRLNRFMKDVEQVTGHMGESEVMTRAEEASFAGLAAETTPAHEHPVATGAGADDAVQNAQQPIDADPWQALAQVGAQLVSALASANDSAAPAHSWIERDPATGVSTLKVPLPSPETARLLADAFSMLAGALRSKA